MASLLGNVFAGAAQGLATGNYEQVRSDADEKRKLSYLRIAQQFQQDNARLQHSLSMERDKTNRANAIEDAKTERTWRQEDDATKLANEQSWFEKKQGLLSDIAAKERQSDLDFKLNNMGRLSEAERNLLVKQQEEEYNTRVERYGKEAADEWRKRNDLGLQKSTLTGKERADQYDKALKQAIEMGGMGEERTLEQILADADAIFARMIGGVDGGQGSVPLASERIAELAEAILAMPGNDHKPALQEIAEKSGMGNAQAVVSVMSNLQEQRKKRNEAESKAKKKQAEADEDYKRRLGQLNAGLIHKQLWQRD